MQAISKMVESIVVYVVLITIVMNVIGNSTYRKYVQIFTGMLLILIVLNPVLKLLNWDDTLELHLGINEQVIISQEMKQQLTMAEDDKKKWILADYKKNIEKTLAQMLEVEGCRFGSCDIVFNETEEKFGEIESIILVCEEKNMLKTEEMEENLETQSLIKKVEKIRILDISLDEKSVYKEMEEEKPNQKSQTKSSVEKNLRKSIIQWLGIDNNSIVISWEAEAR